MSGRERVTRQVDRIRGLELLDHEITVPLVHDQPDGRMLRVYAREVRRCGDGVGRPALLFLQGGPGGESPRPTAAPADPAWLNRALVDYRVLLLDQRGTGRSSPVGLPPDGVPPQELAETLTHYRADAIVRDAELLREHLGIRRWSVLGQSFGGFCALTYLTLAPGSLREVFFTGGLPAVGMPVEQVYADTYARMIELSRRHHRRFPADAARLRAVQQACERGEVLLPSGEPLSTRQLRCIGGQLGMAGGSEAIHYLLERDPASPGFRHGLLDLLPFTGRSPLYTLVHEACYADGGATRWASQRVLPAAYQDDPLLFTAEHVYPWHLQECAELRPWAPVADLLADHDWPRLYDEQVLAGSDVPCAAAIYVDDPFVLREHSMQTAELLPTLRPWITNELLHNGLRADGAALLDRLIRLARGGW